MEKKNVIFLSVIAVATLLTAVIGTTFAYFTANFTVSNQDNATSTVNTKTLVGTTVTLGAPIKPTETVYPGFKGVQEVTVEGTKTGEVPGKVTLTVTPTIATEFGTDIEWALYESTTKITCNDPVTNTTADGAGNKVYQTTECTDVSSATPVIAANTASAEKKYTLTVNAGETHKFYLVAEYKNNTTTAQNSAQGKSFGFTVTANQEDNTTK